MQLIFPAISAMVVNATDKVPGGHYGLFYGLASRPHAQAKVLRNLAPALGTEGPDPQRVTNIAERLEKGEPCRTDLFDLMIELRGSEYDQLISDIIRNKLTWRDVGKRWARKFKLPFTK